MSIKKARKSSYRTAKGTLETQYLRSGKFKNDDGIEKTTDLTVSLKKNYKKTSLELNLRLTDIQISSDMKTNRETMETLISIGLAAIEDGIAWREKELRADASQAQLGMGFPHEEPAGPAQEEDQETAVQAAQE